MGRTCTVYRTGVTVAAAVVLLTACGGSDKKNGASSSSASVTSAAKTSTADTSEFCSSAATIQAKIVGALAGPGSGAGAAAALPSILTQIRGLQPPTAIASDWATISAGLEHFAASQAPVDPNDPGSAAAFQKKVVELETQLGPSLTNVLTYLGSACGVSTPSTSAAPTS
jgi:hypothetical protein